jgi:CheY-like chemotaxis protein
MVREAALRKRIRLSSRFDPHLVRVFADPVRLRQILVNLLGNAVKFTPEGGSVSIETAADAEGGRACFTVRDDGIGIAAVDLPRLFQPFVQLDSSLSREHAGTGLGLSLVLRLAELHGGGVSVESAPGAGSRFTVALPWSPEEQDALEAEPGSPPNPLGGGRAPVPAPVLAGGDPPLLLVADDHDANVAAVQGYLSAAGYRIAVARNGFEAVERTVAARPDLVLMDVQMPGIDGLEAARRIRKLGEVGRVPIVVLTALATADDRARSLAAGVDAYLSKPVPLARLAEVVADHLRNGARRAGP